MEHGLVIFQQTGGIIKLENGAFVKDEYFVIVEDGVDAVSDGENRDADKRLSDGLLYHGICLQIHRRSRFIQHQDLRFPDNKDRHRIARGQSDEHYDVHISSKFKYRILPN